MTRPRRMPLASRLLSLAAVGGLGLLTLVGTGGGGGNGGGSGGGPLIEVELPFAYITGSRFLEHGTPGGTIYISVGPYGAHFLPLTGHAGGDLKSNLIGLFVSDRTALTELMGNGDGVCDPTESCGFFGGIGGANVRSRIPTYIAPMNVTLTRVTMNSVPGPGYFDDVPHWEIEMRLSSRFTLRIGHLGAIAPPLRDKILLASGIDTNTYMGPPGHILIGASIAVSAGEALAQPQVVAAEVVGSPGFYRGGGTGGAPWAQMEFNIIDHAEGADVCVYALMEATSRAAIQAAMDADMADPAALRYASYAATRWAWSAEGVLCTAYSPNPRDFSSIHTNLGGWNERAAAGTTPDEIFSIVNIIKTAASYDPANYDSPAVNHLVIRTRSGGSFNWTMPDSTVVTPFIPIGEVLDETGNSLLIKWRDIGWTAPVYQRAAFLLDAQGLKVKWGSFAADAASAVAPVLAAGEPCDDIDVLCYAH